jgi:hypothetical protein
VGEKHSLAKVETMQPVLERLRRQVDSLKFKLPRNER